MFDVVFQTIAYFSRHKIIGFLPRQGMALGLKKTGGT